MLYVPFIVGVIVGGKFSLPSLLLLFSISFLFISRPSLHACWRAWRKKEKQGAEAKWLLILVSLAALAGLPLLVVYDLRGVIFLGAAAASLLVVNAEQATRREDRTVANEIMAILGLTLSAPAAFYVETNRVDLKALCLWAMCALYFASSVFYVRLRVYSVNPRKEREKRRLWRHCAFYHLFLLLSLASLAITGNIGIFAFIAFAPALFRSFWSMFVPPAGLNLKKIGVLEIVYSIIFLVFASMSFASQ